MAFAYMKAVWISMVFSVLLLFNSACGFHYCLLSIVEGAGAGGTEATSVPPILYWYMFLTAIAFALTLIQLLASLILTVKVGVHTGAEKTFLRTWEKYHSIGFIVQLVLLLLALGLGIYGLSWTGGADDSKSITTKEIIMNILGGGLTYCVLLAASLISTCFTNTFVCCYAKN